MRRKTPLPPGEYKMKSCNIKRKNGRLVFSGKVNDGETKTYSTWPTSREAKERYEKSGVIDLVCTFGRRRFYDPTEPKRDGLSSAELVDNCYFWNAPYGHWIADSSGLGYVIGYDNAVRLTRHHSRVAWEISVGGLDHVVATRNTWISAARCAAHLLWERGEINLVESETNTPPKMPAVKLPECLMPKDYAVVAIIKLRVGDIADVRDDKVVVFRPKDGTT